jgi:hypothetical protein
MLSLPSPFKSINMAVLTFHMDLMGDPQGLINREIL